MLRCSDKLLSHVAALFWFADWCDLCNGCCGYVGGGTGECSRTYADVLKVTLVPARPHIGVHGHDKAREGATR